MINIFTKNTFKELIVKIIKEELENVSGLGDSQVTSEELNEILEGYLECALWTEEERLKEDQHVDNKAIDDEDDDDNEIEKLIKLQRKLNNKPFISFITDDLDVDSKIQAYIDIKTFISNAGGSAISEALDDNGTARLGHDIWLTRNGHGAGFFDHSYNFEKELTDAAHKLKQVDLYINADGKLVFGN
jgi:hypothetical protein